MAGFAKWSAAVVLACASGAAWGSMVNVQYTGTGKGSSVKATFGSVTQNVFAGQLKHTISGGTGAAAMYNGNWLTYCTELTQNVNSGTNLFSIVPISALPGSAPMGWAKAQAIFDIYNFAGSTPHTTSTSNDYATAFQLAIWEIIHDYSPITGLAGLSLTSGSFSATKTNGSPLSSAVTSIVQTLFNAIGAGAPANVVGITNDCYQDQILPIPAPGCAVLAGMGLILGASRRRR